MPTQTESGKAFEYSLLMALFEKIRSKQRVKYVEDSSYLIAQKCYNLFDDVHKKEYDLASKAAVNHISHLEPRLENPASSDAELTITIQPDARGAIGDVRDVLITSSDDDWQIGFSAKNNHSAVKHSRLSDKIDFGKKWFGINCSQKYMDDAKKIFAPIRTMLSQNKNMEWKELKTKDTAYYRSILMAFQTEIYALKQGNPNVPRYLIEYLVGKNDFYKIIKYTKYTRIQGYNLHGTLNKRSTTIKPKHNVKKLNIPTEIIRTKIIDNNKLSMIFDCGWTLSFRIHNADTKIQPSLKFDIQLVGIPNNMYDDREWW